MLCCNGIMPRMMQGMVDGLKEQLSLRGTAQRQPGEGSVMSTLPAPMSAPESPIKGSLPDTALPRRLREHMSDLIDSCSEVSKPYWHSLAAPATGDDRLTCILNRELSTLPIKKKPSISENSITHICCYLGEDSLQMKASRLAGFSVA